MVAEIGSKAKPADLALKLKLGQSLAIKVMDMFALEQRLANLETQLVEAQKNRQRSEAQLSRQDRFEE